MFWVVDWIIFEFFFYWYSVLVVMKVWLDEVFDDDLLGMVGDWLVGKEFGLVVNIGWVLKDFVLG